MHDAFKVNTVAKNLLAFGVVLLFIFHCDDHYYPHPYLQLLYDHYILHMVNEARHDLTCVLRMV